MAAEEPRRKLAERLNAHDATLRASLQKARAQFANSTNRGTGAEDAFRQFLAEHLPRNYGVGHGEVWDQRGNVSTQLDAVIANADHPFTYTQSSPGLFFVEGVLAVAEVKSRMTSDELSKTIDLGVRFKTLSANQPIGTVVRASPAELHRFVLHPPCFCFAYESALTLEKIQEHLVTSGAYVQGSATNTIDAIFVLDRGVVLDVGDGSTLSVRRDDTTRATGWIVIKTDHVLFDLLTWLYATVPCHGPARSFMLSYLAQTES